MSRPNLLYLTPITPAPEGVGLAMRAYHNLLALSSAYSIFLLVVPTSIPDLPLHPSLRTLCERIVRLPLHPVKDFLLLLSLLLSKFGIPFPFGLLSLPIEMKTLSQRRMKAAAHIYGAIPFEVIHVFRLYMYPCARLFLGKNRHNVLQLDLDDIESLTRWDLHNLLLLNGETAMARRMEEEAKRYEEMEREWLTDFDRIFVCSASDREKISLRHGCDQVEVVPNIVRVTEPCSEEKKTWPFTFLFIANFAYYPNLDGLTFFCDQVLPMIRNRVSTAFTIKVVGRGIPRKLTAYLSTIAEIDIAGPVSDTERCYREAHAAIIPIRAGGGTRIKVLEAMAYRLPVVSTTKGVEGLELLHQVHVLLGDTSSAFAEHCCHVMTLPDLRRQLVENASARFYELYTLDRVRQVLCGNQYTSHQTP
jgi:glycosyltransferase involved in cell wall biosynthesis